MKTLLLIFILNQGFASGILTVAHKKKLQPDGHGTIQITEKGIVYQAKKEQDRRTWAYPDIQYFDRLRKNEFIIGTYEDQRWLLGRDRQYRFVVTEGELNDDLFQTIRQKLHKPTTNRVVTPAANVEYEVPVKHLHTLGGCQGTLQFTRDAILYDTAHGKDARQWQLAVDVQSVSSLNRYQLEIRVFENNRREFNRTRSYRFALKDPLNVAFYRTLKLRLYELETVHLPLP